ncbi:isocitrate/isopropylmalate family dehydrogenase [Amycolatopsis sp. NPDC004079]|uniref:isocitrate/isopropylmalate dehydrogenase family protein n=1 Tax=Amycolatopsis sp. NPDC004079 TaxID=3154549 RepID=UPI0033AA80C3
MARKLSVVPGDGIGPEVIDQALAALDALGTGIEVDVLDHVNADTFLRTGVALSDKDFTRIAASDGVLLGAIGDPRVSADYARDVLLRLRFDLDLYVNYRPAKLFHDRLSPLRDATRRGIDCAVVRENTEGSYTGAGGVLRAGSPHEVAIDVDITTRHGVSRIADFAFRTARREVCLVDKSNAVPFGGGLWQRHWRQAGQRHPGIGSRHLYVDAAVMKLVEDPTRFDVILANNAHGDIISDLTAQLAGGIGTSASVNLNADTGFGLYEPVHGAAPDIAGKGIANPIGAILCVSMLLDQFGCPDESEGVRRAVNAAIGTGRVTPDLGGVLRTDEAGAAVRAKL